MTSLSDRLNNGETLLLDGGVSTEICRRGVALVLRLSLVGQRLGGNPAARERVDVDRGVRRAAGQLLVDQRLCPSALEGYGT